MKKNEKSYLNFITSEAEKKKKFIKYVNKYVNWQKKKKKLRR